MLRCLILCVLALCLFGQGLCHAGARVALAAPGEQRHELLHFEGVAHHHDDHDEQGLHEDHSPASTSHMVTDACTLAPALLPSAQPWTLSVGQPILRAGSVEQAHAYPCLQGLERPPKVGA